MSTNNQSLKTIWQKLPSETIVFNQDQMRRRVEKFQSKHKRRTLAEYLGFVALLGLIACYLTFRSDWKAWVASGLAVICSIIMLWNYNRIAKLKISPSSSPDKTMIQYMRRELTRQRDAAATAWRWQILPLTPFFIFVIGFRWLEEGTTLRELTDARIVILSILVFLMTYLVAHVFWQFLNAARYQRQLDILDKSSNT